jgi:hypothetical protein
VKLLGLLGSHHAGERDAAGLAASRLLQRHRLTWADVLTPALVHRELPMCQWRQTCAKSIARRNALPPWEQDFIAGLPKFRRLSIRQAHVLSDIARRILGAQHG